MTQIQGHCPLGCGEGLILGEGGQIWCADLLCPRPTAAAEILADAEADHVVVLGGAGFTVRHPLRERLDDLLMSCTLHEYLANLPGPPQPPGRYRVTGEPASLSWTSLP
jgi:uncharacterized protein DUF6085